MMHIAYCPYFQKMYQFPSLMSSKFINFPPNLLFLLNKRVLLSPYFDHDAFMRHALHVCYCMDAPVGHVSRNKLYVLHRLPLQVPTEDLLPDHRFNMGVLAESRIGLPVFVTFAVLP